MAHMGYANTINCYFCDVLPVMHQQLCQWAVGTYRVGTDITVPHLSIFISTIWSSLFSCTSAAQRGRPKAFRTCSFHMTEVSLLFASDVFMQLSQVWSMDEANISVIYTSMVCVMNYLNYNVTTNMFAYISSSSFIVSPLIFRCLIHFCFKLIHGEK